MGFKAKLKHLLGIGEHNQLEKHSNDPGAGQLRHGGTVEEHQHRYPVGPAPVGNEVGPPPDPRHGGTPVQHQEVIKQPEPEHAGRGDFRHGGDPEAHRSQTSTPEPATFPNAEGNHPGGDLRHGGTVAAHEHAGGHA